MGYGARATRAPARVGVNLQDVDMYKVGLMGNFQRGLAGIQKQIYNIDDFIKKCGGFNRTKYSAYVAKTFYDSLDGGVSVEMKALAYVATDAVQATDEIMDGTPTKIFDINAGMKNAVDKSAYGNSIAYKISRTENFTAKLTVDTGVTPTIALLDHVDHLKVGNQFKIADGINTEYAEITAVDTALKQITFAALVNTYTQALTTISRLDWSLFIAVKDAAGVYQQKEEWLDRPFIQSDTEGMAGEINHPDTGSDYVILVVDSGNATAATEQRPNDVTTWTPLASGSDGTLATDSDWNTLISTLQDEEITIMLAPESTSAAHNSNMADFATINSKWMYFGQAANRVTEDGLKALGSALRKTYVFGMVPSDKWIETDDPSSSQKIEIPKVGYDAAHWFNTYTESGASKVSAGNKKALNTSDKLIDDNDLIHDDIDGDGGRLIRDYSINICRYRQGKGITNNSARTLSTDDGYKYQNQIMQFLLYKRSILAYLKTIEQDKSGVKAQESHYNAVWTYLNKKYKAGDFFQGQKEDGTLTTMEDVIVIINDFSINTLADIANGIEQIFFQFVSPPPIEEPILNIASASVTTVRG